MTKSDRLANDVYESLVQQATENGWDGTRRTRISADSVRAAFLSATRGRIDDDQPEQALAECVEVLRDRGLLRPMAATNREKIPLACGFHLEPIARKLESVTPPAPIWHRELYDLDAHWKHASPIRRAQYVAVNKWLKSRVDRTPVPVRERCLDVFAMYGPPECQQDAEKTLDKPTTVPLFGEEERLMKVLRTFRTPPPLLSEILYEETSGGYRKVGSGDLLVVVENSTTWWSFVEALSHVRDHRVGYVAWGLGMSFVRSVRSISARHRIEEVRYFGDLDLSGILIPARAAAIARAQGLPPVVPAKQLYGALLALGRPSPSREPAALARVGQGLSWLDSAHRLSAEHLLKSDSRIAQEWVGLRYLTTAMDWHEDLR